MSPESGLYLVHARDYFGLSSSALSQSAERKVTQSQCATLARMAFLNGDSKMFSRAARHVDWATMYSLIQSVELADDSESDDERDVDVRGTSIPPKHVPVLQSLVTVCEQKTSSLSPPLLQRHAETRDVQSPTKQSRRATILQYLRFSSPASVHDHSSATREAKADPDPSLDAVQPQRTCSEPDFAKRRNSSLDMKLVLAIIKERAQASMD